jgi:chaperonin cofactor prefoldin
MERDDSSAGCDVQTILEEIESLRSRLRKMTADLYAVQGKSAADQGIVEQNVDPLLQRNEHLAQQLAETQEKLYTNLVPDMSTVLLI